MANDLAEGTKSKLAFYKEAHYGEVSVLVQWNSKDQELEASKCWTLKSGPCRNYVKHSMRSY